MVDACQEGKEGAEAIFCDILGELKDTLGLPEALKQVEEVAAS